MSQAGFFIPGGTGPGGILERLTPDTGGAVLPVANNINIFGTHGINTSNAGNPTMNVSINNAITLGDLAPIATGSSALTATTGDITITSGNFNMANTSAAGADGVINFGGIRFIHQAGSRTNTFVGDEAGNFTVTGTENTGIGSDSLASVTTSFQNTACGVGTLQSLTGLCQNNCAFGDGSLLNLVTGSSNCAYGSNSGSSYTGAESSNILIGRNVTGTLGESNVLRIGSATGAGVGQLNKSFIAGINGVTASNAVMVTVNSSTDQLGVQAIPQGANAWTVVTSTPQAIAVNNGYISNLAGLITYTLPATSAVGDIFEITNINTALGWTVTQGAGQQIRVGNATTTLGAGGSLSSLALGDSIRCVCTVANTIFVALSTMGNLTIV